MSVRILVDGLGDVAPVANWDLTEFNVAANGETNLSQIVLRDFEPIPTSYIAGKRVTVDRGPGTETMFGGYVWKSGRGFWFPVDDPTRLHRQWRLSVVDNNVLFSKRVVFKKADIANPVGPKYGTYGANECLTPSVVAYDDDVIANLVANYLDLSTDSLDTVSKVIRVANIYYGQPTYPYNGGDTFGDAMAAISQIPAAVYCIDPDWALVYHDVDLETAPFALSDRYLADGAKGYRECTVWTDGSQLANDFMGWGAGQGADNMVFQRIRDAASISAHRLWQDATTRYDVWCQGTMDRIVLSAVDGSPTSQRGHKDDILAVDIATYENGLRVAQGVHFINHEYGIDMVLPIRKMRIGFDGPDTPRYDLHLAHVVDRWGFADPPPPLDYGGGGTVVPPVLRPKVGGGCLCGITDTFSRTVSGNWGISDSSIAWGNFSSAYYSVDGNYGVVSAPNSQVDQLSFKGMPTLDCLMSDVTLTLASDLFGDTSQMTLQFKSGSTSYFLYWDGSGNFTLYTNLGHTTIAWPTTMAGFDLRFHADSSGLAARMWPHGTAEPGGWTVTQAGSETNLFDEFHYQFDANPRVGTNSVFSLSALDITGVDKCSAYRFDSFNRVVAGGWGTSDYGTAWAADPNGSVDGSAAHVVRAVGNGSSINAPADVLDITMAFTTQTWPTGTCRWILTANPGGADISSQTNILLFFSEGFGLSVYRLGVEVNVAFSWAQAGHYLMRVHADLAATRVKVWIDGTTEPSSWTVENTTPMSAGTSVAVFGIGAPFTGTGSDGLIDYVDFDYPGKPCYVSGGVPVYPPPGISPPLSGKFCETVSGNLATYALSRPFVPGSIDLFANGVYQVEGVDYTDVPGAGTVTFPATASRTLDVCYLIA